MTAGKFQSDLALENKDELGQVVASFNAVAKRLRSEWLQAQGESAHAKAAEAMLRQAFNTVQLLQAVAVAANSAETTEEALQTTLTEVCAYTGCPVGHAYFLDGDYADGLVSTKLWHLEDPERFATFRKITEAIRIPAGVGLPGRVLASRKPIWISGATKDSNFPRIRLAEGLGTHTDFDITLGGGSEEGTRASNLPRAGVAESLGLKAGFGFPVLAGSEVAAVLEFFAPEVIEPDRALLDTMVHVGTQLGRVIEREQVRAALQKARNDLEIRVQERTAELMRANESLTRDLAEAANYVRSILPPPLHGPVATDWRFVPSATLGGDSFGYHWIDSDHFAFYLLDVCGHGVGAALLSGSVISALRSNTLPDIDFREPGDVLTALNAIFPMERQNNLFFTIWYGVFCRSTWRLKYASAGHPPALLIHGASDATAKVQQLLGKGPFVGAVPEFVYRSEECTVPCPSRIFVVSDGTYEVQKPDGTMLDFSEFISFLVRPVAAGGSELDRLLELVCDLNGPGPLEDDFSILKCEFST
jgi:serine phosphatase RsbU (regulator of sigma subunit)